jgi:DNA-directed RNA polymerase beta' subunit
MGLTEDTLVGIYGWSRYGAAINARQAMKMMIQTSCYNGWLPEPSSKDGWMAQDIMSLVFPKISISSKDDENKLEIVHGKFVEGFLSKVTAGARISKIIHRVWKDYGPETTRLFMDDMMQMAMQWHLINGFSIGLIDCEIDIKTKTKVKEIIDTVYEKASKEITKLRDGQIERKYASISLNDQFEMEMSKMLQAAREEASGVTYKSLNPNNRISSTVT